MKKIGFLPLIIVLLLLAGLSLPAANIHAQNDDEFEDDKFVAALVSMAINYDMMAGKDEIRDLAALHGWVSDYYDKRIAKAEIDGLETGGLKLSQSLLTKSLANEIKIKRGVDVLNRFLATFTNGGETKDSHWSADEDVRYIVSGYKSYTPDDDIEYDPETDFFTVMHSHIMTDFPTFVDLCMDVATIQSYPSLALSISDNSDWSYSPSLVNTSTGGLTGQSDDDGGSSADFWDPGDTGSSLSDSAAPIGGSDDSDSAAGRIDIHKPVRFINNSFNAVTVVVESYAPAQGLSPAVSSASTVVFPGSKSSAYLDLPQGTYTFCYYWQLDTDYNNDDYFDYHHRSTSPVTLNENSSSKPENAVTVSLNPDSTVSNPSGKCGENFAANQGNETLTIAEAANAGTHFYEIDCYGWDFCGESELATMTTTFSSGTVIMVADNGETEVLTRLGVNQYRWTGNDGIVWTVDFSQTGFSYSTKDPSLEPGGIIWTLQD